MDAADSFGLDEICRVFVNEVNEASFVAEQLSKTQSGKGDPCARWGLIYTLLSSLKELFHSSLKRTLEIHEHPAQGGTQEWEDELLVRVDKETLTVNQQSMNEDLDQMGITFGS